MKRILLLEQEVIDLRAANDTKNKKKALFKKKNTLLKDIFQARLCIQYSCIDRNIPKTRFNI